jgi:hypothetical protein
VIEITFKGEDYATVFREIDEFLDWAWADKRLPARLDPMARREPSVKVEEPAKSEKPKPDVYGPDRERVAERMAKVRAAKAKKKPEPTDLSVVPKGAKGVIPKPQEPPPSDPRSSDEAWEADKLAKLEDLVLEADLPTVAELEAIDPTKLAALRVKTTEDLQAAYSSGKHKQVLALLSKYGNGAKSFRELQIDDFIPIRKAIDDGALA